MDGTPPGVYGGFVAADGAAGKRDRTMQEVRSDALTGLQGLRRKYATIGGDRKENAAVRRLAVEAAEDIDTAICVLIGTVKTCQQYGALVVDVMGSTR